MKTDRPEISYDPKTMMYRYRLGDHYMDIDKITMDKYNMQDVVTYANYILGESNLHINYAPDTSSTIVYNNGGVNYDSYTAAYIQSCDNKIYDEITGIKLKNILSIITEYVRIVICIHNRNYEYDSKNDIEECHLEKEIIEIYPKDDIMYIELEE